MTRHVIRTLTQDDLESLHAAFVAAFSDYVVKLTPTPEQLAEMFTRRGWIPELSVGAFDGDAMVAFTVNCVEGDRAYDSGTGVVPSHRRRGLGRELMERSFELLRGRCTSYVLEVLEANTRAVVLYRATGFEVVRELQCWSYESSSPVVGSS
ncbi:MAG: GNAT family N-acetyltransferase, partial [Thermoanaerobaculia bacterium]